LEGREADDEAMFEKRYVEYLQENEGIVCEYRERGLLVEVDTSKGTEESWEKLCNRLEKNIKWTDVIHG
jgi:adenylate kinase family enzyme